MVHYKPYFERRYPWIERCVALLALLNLALVFFDKFNYVKNLAEMEGRQLIERAEELHKQVRG
ncbi:hypothetical protein QQ054_37360 [Oscillatoria amoena NRMC-F 0135]|nr:hypothetical protein [Desertifilum sp.]MDI9640836.1 hypothetical protein [Geitlerinema splendidum]MDL5051677.1 hypothetical protein [Oscillatoria amoena NRMC-F 0135]